MDENENENKILGEGKLLKLMVKFAVPCVLSLLVSALYNIVDQIFVGNSKLGDLGNAATGVVFPIFIIAQAFAWWFGDGSAAYLNICQGKKQTQNVHRSIGTGIFVTVAVSVILMAVFYPLKRQLLLTFGASADSIDYAVEYFNIVLGFFPIFMAMNMINAVVRADGSPAWSMASMLTGAIINIILDPVFIFACDMGMTGAAWATVIGQTASFGICLFYLLKKTKTFKLKLKSLVPDFKEFAGAVKLGLSSFITQMTIVIISLVCNIMLKSYGGASVYGENIPIAIIAIESKVFTVVVNLVVGIVLGCQPIIGYNVGAKNYGRVKKLYLYILLSTVVIGLLSTLIFELAPRGVAGIFGSPKFSDPELYWEFAAKTFRIFLMFVTFTCTIKMTSIFFQAAGCPVRAIVASLIRDIVCFIPLITTLPIALGIEGILWAAPIADGVAMPVAAALTVHYFAKQKKKNQECAMQN
ncbi:MAG: MATE family efflux transporter [Clostridiales bacterium]|nr:MATE family efflux transporter [Clostridiales bacterium]